MNIRMIAMDMDDTFVRSDKKISSANLQAVKDASERGIFVVPATGRTYCTLPREVVDCPFIRYMITVNGARVWDKLTGEYLFSDLISFNDVLGIIKAADSFGGIADVCIDEEFRITKAQEDILVTYFPEDIRWFIRTIHTAVDDMPKLFRDSKKDSEKMLVFFNDRSKQEKFCDFVEKNYAVNILESIPGQIEITAKNASKGGALSRLGRLLGIEKSEIMALGDSGNDEALIEGAGFFVAMGNGSEELKSKADAICESCDDDGFAKSVYRWAVI